MPGQVVIDGNNLLHAMHEHAPLPPVGRETLVRIIERWARLREDEVMLVFDGAAPRGELRKQMSSSRITVCFSAPASADDIIVDVVARAKDPALIRVITGDTAIRREARYRRCRHTDVVEFIRELFPPTDVSTPPPPPAGEKPEPGSANPVENWMQLFGYEDDEPFEGFDAMQP